MCSDYRDARGRLRRSGIFDANPTTPKETTCYDCRMFFRFSARPRENRGTGRHRARPSKRNESWRVPKLLDPFMSETGDVLRRRPLLAEAFYFFFICRGRWRASRLPPIIRKRFAPPKEARLRGSGAAHHHRRRSRLAAGPSLGKRQPRQNPEHQTALACKTRNPRAGAEASKQAQGGAWKGTEPVHPSGPHPLGYHQQQPAASSIPTCDTATIPSADWSTGNVWPPGGPQVGKPGTPSLGLAYAFRAFSCPATSLVTDVSFS